MALRLKTENIPQNAVILTRSEAVKYQWKQIFQWKPESDVWSFVYGPAILGGVAAVSGACINIKFRRLMKMREYGAIATMTAASLCPTVLAFVFHNQYVASKLLLPVEQCSVCIQLRALSIQNFCGIGYPFLLVPISNFMLAIRGQTHRIPYYNNYKELFRFCGTLYKPMIPHFAVLSIVNSIAANLILYYQYKCVSYMNDVITMKQITESDKMNNIF